MGAISGDINTASFHCVDAQDLASRPCGALDTGDFAFVESYKGAPEGPYFFYDRTSSHPASGSVIVPQGSPAKGRWLALAVYGIPGGGGGGPAFQFVYRPGDPAPSGSVYADWAALVDAAASVVGDKEVFFLSDLAPCFVPEGSWDFGPGQTTFVSDLGNTGLPYAGFIGDITIRGVSGFRNFFAVVMSTSAVPTFDLHRDSGGGEARNEASFVLDFSYLGTFDGDGSGSGGPLLGTTNPNKESVNVLLANRSGVSGINAIESPNDIYIVAGEFSGISSGALNCPNGEVQIDACSSSSIGKSQPEAPNLTRKNYSLARSTTYDDSAPMLLGPWPATDVEAALERIKELLTVFQETLTAPAATTSTDFETALTLDVLTFDGEGKNAASNFNFLEITASLVCSAVADAQVEACVRVDSGVEANFTTGASIPANELAGVTLRKVVGPLDPAEPHAIELQWKSPAGTAITSDPAHGGAVITARWVYKA